MLAGARGFTPRTAYAAGAASDLALGDLNDDGMTDVVLFGNDEGVSYLLGRASAMEGDLAVFLGLNAGTAVVRIENRGGDFSVGSYELNLRVEPRIGSIGGGTAPGGCETYDWNGLLEAYCQMPSLAPGAFHELAFPFEVTAPTQRNLLFGRARASSSSPELRLDNNVVSKRVYIVLPAE
jgi:hypothetical protein